MIARAREFFARPPTAGVVARAIPKWLVNKPLPNVTDFRGLAEAGYRRHEIIYVCIRELAQTAADPLVTVVRRGDKRRVPLENHAALALLDKPNPLQSRYEFLELLITHLQSLGNAYIHKVRSKAGNVVELWLLRPDRTKIVPGPDGMVARYVYSVGGEETGISVPPEDVVHLKLPDPLDDYYGLPPTFVAARVADLDTNGIDYLRAFFLNSGTPAGLLKFKIRVEKDERERVKEQWIEQHTGLAGWHALSVLDADVDYQPIGAAAKDTSVEHVFDSTEARLCAVWGVPPIVVGMRLGLLRSTYCLPAEARVATARGPIPIRDVAVGEPVWSMVDGRLELRPVVRSGWTGIKQLYELRTKNRAIRATGNHPFLVRVPGNSAGPNGERHATTAWRRLDEIRPGDWVVQPEALPDLGGTTCRDGTEATPKSMQWLGAWLGDGYVSGPPTSRFVDLAFPPTDRVRGFYEELSREVCFGYGGGGDRPKRQIRDGSTEEMTRRRATGETYAQIGEDFGISAASVRDRVKRSSRPREARAITIVNQPRSFRFASVDTARMLERLGFTEKARTKRIPGWIFGLSRELRLAFLAGLVDSDGSIDKRGCLTFAFASELLVHDVKDMLISVGISSSNVEQTVFRPAEHESAQRLGTKWARDEYELWRITASAAQLIAEIPFADPMYRERVERNAGRLKRCGFDAEKAGLRSVGFYRALSIEPLVEESVYDLEVAGGHSFVADGIVVHNSNYKEARASFWAETARPMYTRLGQKLTVGVVAEFDDTAELCFDTSEVDALQESIDSRRKFAVEGWKEGLLDRAQALDLVDMESEPGDVGLFKPAPTAGALPGEEEEPEEEPAALQSRTPLQLVDGRERHLDPPDEPAWKTLHRVADKGANAIRKAFLEAAAAAAGDTVLRDVEDALRNSDYAKAEAAIPWEAAGVRTLAATLPVAFRRIVVDAGVSSLLVQPAGISFRFDTADPFALQAAEHRSAALVREISEETRGALRQSIRRAIAEGRNPRRTAREIRDIIGLTRRQEGAVHNLRKKLEASGLGAEDVDRRVARLADKLTRRRALTIARTESLWAANTGQQILWEQARQAGLISSESLRKWVVTPDDRLAIVGARTQILTREGWKAVSKVKVGDHVLTHRDRFCRVSRAESKWYDGPTVKIEIGCKAVRRVHVTYGHPILVNRDGGDMWVLAENVRETDDVYVNGVPCVDCGGVIPAGSHYPPDLATARCHPCNVKAQNESPSMRKKQRDAVRAFNKKKWTAAARKAQAERWTGEKSPVRAALKARGRKNYGQSWPERKVAWWLAKQGIAFEPQWMFRYGPKNSRGFADFYLPGPRIVVECDGSTHREDPVVAERDRAKDEYLVSQGIRVLRFTDLQIREDVGIIADPIREACCIVRHPIKRVVHATIRHNPVYHLTVEGDESYIAGGVVVHNCPFCAPMKDKLVRLDEPFTSGAVDQKNGRTVTLPPVIVPPLHPNCRCSLVLVPGKMAVDTLRETA
ncbi:MAG: phage portal protein [Actinobacteria bacterium]|nr:phage portal protein [Actinomycetota bacterium]